MPSAKSTSGPPVVTHTWLYEPSGPVHVMVVVPNPLPAGTGFGLAEMPAVPAGRRDDPYSWAGHRPAAEYEIAGFLWVLG